MTTRYLDEVNVEKPRILNDQKWQWNILAIPNRSDFSIMKFVQTASMIVAIPTQTSQPVEDWKTQNFKKYIKT